MNVAVAVALDRTAHVSLETGLVLITIPECCACCAAPSSRCLAGITPTASTGRNGDAATSTEPAKPTGYFEDPGQRFTRSPADPLDLDELTAMVEAPPHGPAAIEAVRHGDSEGWTVDLMAVTIEPRAEYHLATIQHGTDIRLFNGEVPPWPEAQGVSVNRARAGGTVQHPISFREPR